MDNIYFFKFSALFIRIFFLPPFFLIFHLLAYSTLAFAPLRYLCRSDFHISLPSALNWLRDFKVTGFSFSSHRPQTEKTTQSLTASWAGIPRRSSTFPKRKWAEVHLGGKVDESGIFLTRTLSFVWIRFFFLPIFSPVLFLLLAK